MKQLWIKKIHGFDETKNKTLTKLLLEMANSNRAKVTQVKQLLNRTNTEPSPVKTGGTMKSNNAASNFDSPSQLSQDLVTFCCRKRLSFYEYDTESTTDGLISVSQETVLQELATENGETHNKHLTNSKTTTQLGELLTDSHSSVVQWGDDIMKQKRQFLMDRYKTDTGDEDLDVTWPPLAQLSVCKSRDSTCTTSILCFAGFDTHSLQKSLKVFWKQELSLSKMAQIPNVLSALDVEIEFDQNGNEISMECGHYAHVFLGKITGGEIANSDSVAIKLYPKPNIYIGWLDILTKNPLYPGSF